MKNILKKVLVATICMMLVASLMGVGALAAKGQNNGKSNEKSAQSGQSQSNGKSGQNDQGNQNAKSSDRQGNGVRTLAISLIQEKIAQLEDGDVKEALGDLLEAYEAAVEAENAARKDSSTSKDALEILMQATATARSALAEALTDAGIALAPEKRNDDENGNSNSNSGRFGMVNTDNIEKQIANIDDADTQKALTELLEAYKKAVAAEKAGFENSTTTESEMKAFQKATEKALKALEKALYDAEILKHGKVGRAGDAKDLSVKLDTGAIEVLIADVDDADTQKALTELLEAYEKALAAEKAGLDNQDITEDALKALRVATKAASDALEDALDDAGIDNDNYATAPKDLDQNKPSSDASTAGSGNSVSGFFQGIWKWITGWAK